ncbi:MAG: hypothetical protein GF393_11290 [Armatimonadia bacterium]|nr:hypothetical protein [Armatimonadia bacterium]
MLERLGDEITDREDEAIRRHVEQCATCSAQLDRLRWMPAAMRDASRTAPTLDDHPTDLQLAAFAQHGYAADGADRIAHHLSNCRDCREAVVTAWTMVSRHNEGSRDDPASRPPATVMHPLTTPHGLLCALGAFGAFVCECLLLAVALTQFVLAWVLEPIGFEAVPSLGPLAWLSGGPLRFWVLVIGCLTGAALLRWVAGHLLSCATGSGRQRAVSG